MTEMSKSVMLQTGCSYKDAEKFIHDLPNKLVYDHNKKNISFEIYN